MDTALSPPVGQLLGGRYHVGSRIARGGMATVYLGTDTRLDRVVALKIAHPELADDAEFVRRFIGEARSVARLSSPNLVSVYDQGSDGGLHYIAMEYIAGRTLRQLLIERGRLNAREALDVMTGVLSGLAAAHQAGIAHRDVKPENVLITPAGEVKVADFGLARSVAGAVQTRGGMIIGTAAYLAPEQVTGSSSDARTDVYAAGIVLFELLTGAQPHTGDSPLAVAYKHVNEVVAAPSSILPGVPPSLDRLVAMATSRDPDLRPHDAGQFLRAIDEIRNGQAVAGTAPYRSPGQLQPEQPDSPRQGQSGPLDSSHARADPYAPTLYGSKAYGAASYDSAPYDSAPYDSSPYDSAPHTSSPYGPDPYGPAPATQDGGAVGASALPSLSPQSAASPPPRDAASAINHTLVVPAGAAFADYADGSGGQGGYPGSASRYNDGSYHQGNPYHDSAYDDLYRGGYRRRQQRARQSEPLLQRLLFGRRLWFALGGVIVIVVAGSLTWWLGGGQLTKVPALRGMTVSVAKSHLDTLGLHMRLTHRQHSPLPKGEIIAISPGPGSKVAGGSQVALTISLGPVMIQVPDVTGQPLSNAQTALRQSHLKPGKITKEVSGTVPVGDVITTTPVAYASWPQTKPIGLTISEGPGLPSFVGQPVDTALSTAQAGGYTINQVPDAKSSTPVGTVTGQSPPANTPITPGEVVTVRVSQGPPSVAVPDVRGLSLHDAIKVMEQAGFQVTVNAQGPGDRVGSYSPNTPEPKGTTITLNVGIFSGL